MEKSTTKTLVIGVSILLITTGLFFVGRAILNKLNEKREGESADNANEGGSGGNQNIIAQEEEQAKKYNPKNDVDFIYSRISYPNFFTYSEINDLIAGLTDAQVKKLADAYKTKNKGVSLWRALDDEWYDVYRYSQNRLNSLNKR